MSITNKNIIKVTFIQAEREFKWKLSSFYVNLDFYVVSTYS